MGVRPRWSRAGRLGAAVSRDGRDRRRATWAPDPATSSTRSSTAGTAWISAIFIAACLAAALLALWAELTAEDRDDERRAPIFALTLISVGLLLILGCEFFYVGDVFKSRMNTVFKLYYQAWLLLAIAGGFSLYYLASSWRVTFPQAVTYKRVWAGAAADHPDRGRAVSDRRNPQSGAPV